MIKDRLLLAMEEAHIQLFSLVFFSTDHVKLYITTTWQVMAKENMGSFIDSRFNSSEARQRQFAKAICFMYCTCCFFGKGS